MLLEIIRLSFYAVAGMGGVVALTIAYRKQRLGEAAEAREDSKLFTEQFAAAADQLSSDQVANRLAGVYAMASLADDWDHGRQKCINVLCAYIRMPYDPPVPPPEPSKEQTLEYKLACQEQQVRQTIMDTIGEHLRVKPVAGKSWHQCDFDFRRATLDSGELGGSVFLGNALFNGAHFLGTVRLHDVKFQKVAAFHEARFADGVIDFSGTKFLGKVTTFSGASFVGARAVFDGAEFGSAFANFKNVRFESGAVSFGVSEYGPAKFTDGSAYFNGAIFSGAEVDFRGAVFGPGEVDLRSVAKWSNPPKFDPFPGGAPKSLLLPEVDNAHGAEDALVPRRALVTALHHAGVDGLCVPDGPTLAR
jgi:hypothetical protein